MCRLLEEKCGSEAPHSSQIRSAWETCIESIDYLIGPNRPAVSSTEVAQEVAPAPPDGNDGQVTKSYNDKSETRFHGRDQAPRALREVAEYFERHEPHSPVAFGAAKLIRWDRTPLSELVSELVSELIPDPNARDYYHTMVGLDDRASD